LTPWEPLSTPSLISEIIKKPFEELMEKGYVVFDPFMNKKDSLLIALDLEKRFVSSEMQEAGVRGLASTVMAGERSIVPDIRLTATRWLDKEEGTAIESAVWSHFDQLRTLASSELGMGTNGLSEMELLYARYPIGGFYLRHMDSHHVDTPRMADNQTERILSFILYLPKLEAGDMAMEYNQERDGGLLRLWPAVGGRRNEILEDGEEGDEIDIQPKPGTLVLFLSQGLPHQVLETLCVRRSVIGWFRVRPYRTC
jgi:SM-20-related protein